MTSRHGILERKESALTKSGLNINQGKITRECSLLPETNYLIIFPLLLNNFNIQSNCPKRTSEVIFS